MSDKIGYKATVYNRNETLTAYFPTFEKAQAYIEHLTDYKEGRWLGNYWANSEEDWVGFAMNVHNIRGSIWYHDIMDYLKAFLESKNRSKLQDYHFKNEYIEAIFYEVLKNGTLLLWFEENFSQ